ncbi:GntR family transcriptional regulator [Chelatococcus asaccharovorans]|uniref:GntR family transcriptional regulator n=1 Tax=Chelatococcus asaccharovorans TaxID=28210 RepID=A0A2V3UUP2_9HYPH|nr:GntR family transcriptional regulator [Chelatococcus asaccharovorans]MBS7701844.1 GntR family transcriptional regulator [Chelatococcus asaccharovorans]PXW64448.1 GntR family transcriptional regulator [Chelatococcus asaccharovorans]CAH1665868.1 GntR family transcriptional regulator [Chelatococcus asaccharovorans]CAH1681744.1 GntR family transcriptional regulator [Chelatococcus asaccharovorans]
MANAGPVRSVKKVSAEVQAADVLRESIVSGRLPPGMKLTEIKLSEQLEVSRATVRTALHQMAQEGLIVQVPYTGWTVMTLTSRDAWELYTLRSSLEALAARLVVERASRSTAESSMVKERLTKSLKALSAACVGGRKAEIAEADFALHKAIIALSGHRRLAEQYLKVEQQIRIYIASSDSLVPHPEQIVAQHQPLVDAIVRGDARMAAELSVTHNTEQGEILVGYLREQEARESA